MAGITDVPFRTVALKLGAGLVVSEMVASEEVVRARPTARARAELGFGTERTAVQLAGREARSMAEAARWCAGQGARIIDINFGCPAKKVTNGLSGSALMRDPDHALRLIEAVVGAVDVPVTVKMRLGWDDERDERAGDRGARRGGRRAMIDGARPDPLPVLRRARRLGGDRGGQARRSRIPVIANGDIVEPADARARAGAVRARTG